MNLPQHLSPSTLSSSYNYLTSQELLQWKDFWDLFSAVIEGKRLTSREKICHLQASMKSEDAKTVVRHAAAEGNYDEVVTALKKSYDKTRVVYMHHVNALTSRQPIKSNCNDLVHGLQELELHHSGLTAHGSDILGQYLAASTVLLMVPTCGTHWADYTCSKEEPPDLQTICLFFEHWIATLQSMPRRAPSLPLLCQPRPSLMSHCESCQGHLLRSSLPCVLGPLSVPVPFRQGVTAGQALKEKHICLNCLGRGHSQGLLPEQEDL